MSTFTDALVFMLAVHFLGWWPVLIVFALGLVVAGIIEALK